MTKSITSKPFLFPSCNYPLNFNFHFFYRILSGSGEANYDSFESNPFQNAKQRQEQEVQTLLQKLSHEMIGLDASFVAAIDKGET